MTSIPHPATETAIDILAAAHENHAFRRVVQTGEHEQVVVMTIEPRGEIGDEVHPDTDQAFIVVEGSAEAVIDGRATTIGANDLVFVHAGRRHNILNRGEHPLRLITIYAPPAHAPGTIHETKAEADAAED